MGTVFRHCKPSETAEKMKRPGEFTPQTTPSKIATWTVDERPTPDRKRGPSMNLKASPTKQVQKRGLYSKDFIKTYVFFDLECTGLIKNDDTRVLNNRLFDKTDEHHNLLNQLCIETRKDELPYITEMSFMAISSETFDDLKTERLENIKWNENNPESERMLANYDDRFRMGFLRKISFSKQERFSGVLVHSKRECQRNNSFKEEWPGVIQFFNSLQKPALLIGHNALKYDLRVIYGELSRNNLLEDYGIPPDVFFMDSYWMARKIEDTIVKELVTVCKYIKFPKILTARPKQEEVDDDVIIADSFNDPSTVPDSARPTTSNNKFESDHPANILDWDKFSIALRKRIQKDGFVKLSDGGWTYKQNDNKFNLPILFEQLVGGKYNAHYAQQDTEALMHVCLSYGNDFTQYANESASAIPF
uniref:Exonuclease domain-containing protein n=1 Tax=Caenorhabditis tropicalis TaxID=1561998 RepID=A0A1I7TFJ4_9PELO